MPRTRTRKLERVPIRIPKPMTDEIDRIVKENAEYGWNRQQFIENAIAEMIMKVKSTETVLIPSQTYDIARTYYDTHEEELREKHGIRNITDFIDFCMKKYLKEKGIFEGT